MPMGLRRRWLNKIVKSSILDIIGEPATLVIRPNDLLNEFDGAAEIQDAVTRAKQQVEIIINTAQSEAKAVIEEAYEDGYKAGAQQATAQADELLRQLELDIAEVAAERAALVASIEEQVLMLCVNAAEKIIRHEIKTDPQVVARTIKLCLRRVRDRNEITIRVSPSEVELVRGMRDELISSAEGIGAVNIVDDRRISAGGCVVECPSGDFDARIETQIEQLRRKMMDVFAHEFNKHDNRHDEIPDDSQQAGYGTG